MPMLKSDDVQILLVEMQPPIVDASNTVSPARLRRAASALVKIAEAANIPVTASVVALGGQAPTLIEELKSIAPQLRSTITPFSDVATARQLCSTRRKTLVIGGVSTEIAILHTTLAALDYGFAVHILTDLCGGLDARTDQASLEHMWCAGAVPSSLSSFASGLVDDMGSDLGSTVMRTLHDYWGWDDHDHRESDLVQPSVDREVQGLLEQLTNAWSEGDADRFARSFANNARFVPFDGTVLNGRAEIADYHRGPFETYLASTKLTFGAADIRPFGRSAWMMATDGGIERKERTEDDLIGHSVQTFLLRRSEGRLEIVAFQNTRVRPIDGPAAAAVWRGFDESWAKLVG